MRHRDQPFAHVMVQRQTLVAVIGDLFLQQAGGLSQRLQALLLRRNAHPVPQRLVRLRWGRLSSAEIAGGVVLASELSLMAAFTSQDLARAHERLGRGREAEGSAAAPGEDR